MLLFKQVRLTYRFILTTFNGKNDDFMGVFHDRFVFMRLLYSEMEH